jgi:short-chain fatty acids transporter
VKREAPADAQGGSLLTRFAERTCAWSERWFPDAFVFALLAVAIVVLAALSIGASPMQVAVSFGDGFWSIMPFTMQMCFIVIGGYVAADSPPVARMIQRLAAVPRSARGSIALVALVGMLVSLVHWGLSAVISSLLARAVSRREDLHMDYRAAGAAACLGTGTVWALGLSSSSAQLQANPSSMPAAILAVTGVIPFEATIFLWQSVVLALILILVSTFIAWKSAPESQNCRTARDLGINLSETTYTLAARERPGEWLEYSPILTLLVLALGAAWLYRQIELKGAGGAIASLNTYNLLFLMLGLALQWRPRRFLAAVYRSVPSVAGILIQFPFLGAIASLMTTATNSQGVSLARRLGGAFTAIATPETFAPVVGVYSAVLGFFVPSGGGKWLIEAPYVMQAAKDLHYNLGWTVQIYNAAEALPNLINPFWMLPVLGMLGLKARDLIGFTFVQFLVNAPLVLALLWALGATLSYQPPVMPP